MQGREPLRDAGIEISVRSLGRMEPDENRASSSFAELAAAFNAQITELQQLMCLRIEGGEVLFPALAAFEPPDPTSAQQRQRAASSSARTCRRNALNCVMRSAPAAVPGPPVAQTTQSTCSSPTCTDSRCTAPSRAANVHDMPLPCPCPQFGCPGPPAQAPRRSAPAAACSCRASHICPVTGQPSRAGKSVPGHQGACGARTGGGAQGALRSMRGWLSRGAGFSPR